MSSVSSIISTNSPPSGSGRRAAFPYRVDRDLVTTATEIDVVGTQTSDEVETVIFSSGGLWIGLGSDHTDRAAEAYSVALSKQLCRKVVARELWPFAEVAPHWDRLALRAHVVTAGKRRVFPEGNAATLRGPPALLGRYAGRTPSLPEGTGLFCRSHTATGRLAPGHRF